MRITIIFISLFLFVSCIKDEKSEIIELNNSTYDFSNDSCGTKLLKGIYVSNSNQYDTIVIDSNIKTYIYGAMPSSTNYIDVYRYCATKDSIKLDRWGFTKLNTPSGIVKYSISNNDLSFKKVFIPNNTNNMFDTLFTSINNKSFHKIK
jgi:hypothetical protein